MTRSIANLAAALAVLESLHTQGLEHVVLCPGSRSGPLALAAGGLARAGLIQLDTAIDERSAAFLALGRSTASGRASAVITTSGTAVANLLPAAVEADRSCQPLLLLTADRPARLKQCGANQTVNQEEFLHTVCRGLVSGPDQGLDAASSEQLEALAQQAWRGAHRQPGPVHCNLPFEEPLHPSGSEQEAFWISWQQKRLGHKGQLQGVLPLRAHLEAPALLPQAGLDPSRPGVVVAGPWRGLADQRPAFEEALRQWQLCSGWPVLVDPLAAVPADLPGQVRCWDLLLPDQLPLPTGVALADLQVLRLGPMPASRRLEAWLQTCQGPHVLVSEGEPRSLDPLQKAWQWSDGLVDWMARQSMPESSGSSHQALHQAFHQAMVQTWQERDRRVADWLLRRLPAHGAVTEPALMCNLAALIPEDVPVMLAASSPVRDWQAFAPSALSEHRCFSFRGASGIDGTLSLGLGLARVLGRTVLITGDLALLHDSNGWLLTHGPQGAGPLLVLLIDNGGGGIFQQLPVPAAPASALDALFAMPQQVDLLGLAAAHGIPVRQVSCLEDVAPALAWGLAQPGVALVRVCTNREVDAHLRATLRWEIQQLTMGPQPAQS